MRLFLLTAMAMLAFAANSLLNRLALAEGAIGPASFAAIRVGAGAGMLLLLLGLRGGGLPVPRRAEPWSVLGLVAYMLGFSFAYVSMDAGLGALVLFGGVQLTMFLGAVLEGDRPALRRWLGMGLSMAGLAVLSLPSGELTLAPLALVAMGLAAVGWGIYSLRGRGAGDPLGATAWNFVYGLPLVLIVLLLWPDTGSATPVGITLAVLSGAVTSGLGYALWYALLPDLGAARGALAQLSVPVIALVLAAFLLGERVSGLAVLSAAMILGGIAVGLLPSKRHAD